MTPRVLAVCAIATLGLLGCATTPNPGGGGTLGCKTKQCDVSVKHDGFWPFTGLDIVDEVVVTPPVTLTWRITAKYGTKFNPQSGITFTDAGFDCKIDPNDQLVYTCYDTALAGRYKYTIKTKGFGSPPDRDPFIKNN